jgi:hypothetical protein
VASAKLARFFLALSFATRILAMYIRQCDFLSYIQAPLPILTGLMHGLCQSLPVFFTLTIFNG